MFKRFVCCLLALPFLLVPLPVSAWNNQSFVGNDYSSGSFDIPVSSPQYVAPASASTYSSSPSDGIYSGSDLASLFFVQEGTQVGVEFAELQEGWDNDFGYFPDYTFYSFRPDSPLTPSFSVAGSVVSFGCPSFSYNTSFDYILGVNQPLTSGPGDDMSWGSHSTINSIGWSRAILSLDVSSLGDDISDIEFVGSLSSSFSLNVNGSVVYTGDSSSVVLAVNGALTDIQFSALDGLIQFDNYLYSSTEPITSIALYFNLPFIQYSLGNVSSVSTGWDSSFDFSNVQFSFISASSGGVVDVDKVQGEITEHEDIESQWGGSMTENFDALDIVNFSYPDGLASAFALISGIFQDFWYGMGEYGILYVFPLTLAIMLLVIGRLSKFAGRSKSEKGGGD